jgi:hypothetical protein
VRVKCSPLASSMDLTSFAKNPVRISGPFVSNKTAVSQQRSQHDVSKL